MAENFYQVLFKNVLTPTILQVNGFMNWPTGLVFHRVNKNNELFPDNSFSTKLA